MGDNGMLQVIRVGQHSTTFSKPSEVTQAAFIAACKTGDSKDENAPAYKCATRNEAKLKQSFTSLKANLGTAGINYLPEYAMIIANSIQETDCFDVTKEYNVEKEKILSSDD